MYFPLSVTVRCSSDGTGIMFLNEAALGKEHHITMDDRTLRAAPKGYDCVVAKGRTEPGESPYLILYDSVIFPS